jgi:hypothetical protein
MARCIERLLRGARLSGRAPDPAGSSSEQRADQLVEPFERSLPAQLGGDLPRAVPEMMERIFAFDLKDLL